MNEIEKLEAAIKYINNPPAYLGKDNVYYYLCTMNEAARAHLHYKREIEPLVRELVDMRSGFIGHSYEASVFPDGRAGITGVIDDDMNRNEHEFIVCKALSEEDVMPELEFYAFAANIAVKLKERIE